MAVTINGDTGIDKVVDDTITTDDIQDGAITAAKIASGAIPNSYAGTKNLIINGNMQIAQRGTSVASGLLLLQVDIILLIVDLLITIVIWGRNLDSISRSRCSIEGFAKSVKIRVARRLELMEQPLIGMLYYQSIEGFNLQQLSIWNC